MGVLDSAIERAAAALRQRDHLNVFAEQISTALKEEAFQRDPEFLRSFVGLMGLWSRYFAGEVRGLERVPQTRPVLLVGNHSGGALVPDTSVLLHAWYQAKGVDDPLTLLGLDAVFAIPGMATLCRRLGLVPANMQNAERALAAGHVVLLYPGGAHESFRPWSERNRIDLAGRTGFIRLALRHRVPVVPVVGHGGHETLVVLSRGEWLGRLLGMERIRVPMFPLALGIPLGVPSVPLPLPAKVTVQVCAPLDWSRYEPAAADDEATLAKCYREITGVMQHTLDALARERPRPLIARWWQSPTPPALSSDSPSLARRGSGGGSDNGASARRDKTTYAPQERGSHPVGVCTVTLDDRARRRRLTVEVWYPASRAHRGHDRDPHRYDRFALLPGLPKTAAQAAARDAKPAAGRFPLLAFSHGYSSHRRQTTHLCTHLASHGYVVVAPDHTGNNTADLLVERMQGMLDGWRGTRSRRRAIQGVVDSAELRPHDLRFVIDCALDGRLPVIGKHVDRTRVGVAGHSFGGWTALMMPSLDARVRALLALAPSGGQSPVYPDGNPLQDRLRLKWRRKVPTLIVAAERDSILPLEGMRALFRQVRGAEQLVVLRGADHLHFLDHVERYHEYFRRLPMPPLYRGYLEPLDPVEKLVPAEHAYLAVRTLAVAHFDRHLKRDARARRLLTGDVAAVLRAAGVSVDVIARGS